MTILMEDVEQSLSLRGLSTSLLEMQSWQYLMRQLPKTITLFAR